MAGRGEKEREIHGGLVAQPPHKRKTEEGRETRPPAASRLVKKTKHAARHPKPARIIMPRTTARIMLYAAENVTTNEYTIRERTHVNKSPIQHVVAAMVGGHANVTYTTNKCQTKRPPNNAPRRRRHNNVQRAVGHRKRHVPPKRTRYTAKEYNVRGRRANAQSWGGRKVHA